MKAQQHKKDVYIQNTAAWKLHPSVLRRCLSRRYFVDCNHLRDGLQLMVFIVSEILQHIPKNMESSPGDVCSIPSFPAVLSSIFLLRSFFCVSVEWSVVFSAVSVNAWQPAAMKLCISVFHFSQQKDSTCTMFCSVSGWGKPEPGYPASPSALRCWVGEEMPTSVQAPAAIQCTSSSYPCR